MKTLNDISLKEKRVIIRVDFNVPLDDKLVILDDTRILSALPTIKKVISDGGKAIIISHLGRPKNGFEDCFSLKHILNHLSNLLNTPVQFANDCIGEIPYNCVKKMKNGDVLLLENLRFYAEEKKGDKAFAKKLASLADVYINDAFGVAHRSHSSTSVIADYFPKHKYFGYLLSSEIISLNTALCNPKRPFTAIIGGAKISSKISVINSLFNVVDNLIVGGGMAYTFIHAIGGKVGRSLVEKEKLDLAKSLLATAKEKKVNLLLPVDSLNTNILNKNGMVVFSPINNIDENLMGVDIGGESICSFKTVIASSKTIIWNGPMGVFEIEAFSKGTEEVAKAICSATKNGAFSLVGGGDSVAAIKKFNLENKISYLSTGGGAMLSYIEGKILPGIAALEN